MINVVLFTPQWDTGGQGWRIRRAMTRHQPEFNVRSIHSAESYFRYPHDLPYEPNSAYKLFAEADVAHMRNGIEGLPRLASHRGGERGELGVVVHHHGTRFREEHGRLSLMANAINAQQMASTIDLTLLEPGVAWLPSPFDLDELNQFVQRLAGPRPIRIAHAPTNRQVKSTVRIMDAIRNLVKAGYSVEFDLIERVPYEECLRRKAKADIFVDQLELGIGNNALEAFGMEIPVIAGIADQKVRAAMIQRWGELPFCEADTENLEQQLAILIRSFAERAEYAAKGLAYLTQWHEESKVADQLATIYRAAASGAAMEGVA